MEVTSLRKLQLIELDILKEFVRICEENNLTYYISGGTYLGAVRHKGFIPWDDDVDVAMPRTEYEKFLLIAKKQLNKKFVLETYRNVNNPSYYPSMIIDKQIKLLCKTAKNDRIISAWIDIFPLDGMPNNYILSKIHQFDLLVHRAFFKFSCFDDRVNLHDNERPLIEKILIWIGKHTKFGRNLDTKKQLDKIDKRLKKYSPEKSKVYVNFMGAYKFKSIINKEIYAEGAKYEFEGMILNGPKDYDKYLTQIYGEYMNIPDKDMQNKHNTEILEDN